MDQIHLLSLVSSALFPVIKLVFFSFFFLARNALAVDENFTICSEPRFCGRVEIKFPFFIQELQESRCGSPGFNISCRNNTDPILSLPDADYVIHDIFYQNKSFLMSKAVSVCSPSIIRNISFPKDRFYYPGDQRQIFLLFNCNLTLQSTPGLSQYKVACSAQNQTSATLALFGDDPQLNKASAYCNNTMAVPVAFPQEEGGVENMMNTGFLLNWIASDCSVCENSGGKCGFDYETYHFKCFCPDRPHASDCDPVDGWFYSPLDWRNNYVECRTSGGHCGFEKRAGVCFCPRGQPKIVQQRKQLHSVEEKDGKGNRPYCPSFTCGKLGDINFPYTQKDHPKCGLFVVDGCEENVQKVQLEPEKGKWYQVETISEADTITITDQELAKQIEAKDCGSLKNFSLPPNLPSVGFEIHPNLTLCKCNSALNTSLAKEFSHKYATITLIYYNQTGERALEEQRKRNNDDLLLSLCNCPIIQLPLSYKFSPNNNFLDLFELLTPDASFKVEVSRQCWMCRVRGGQCLVENKKFGCNIKLREGNSHGFAIKVAAASSVSGIAVLLLLTILAFRLKRKFSSEEDKKIEAFLKDHQFLAPKRHSYSDIKHITNSFRDRLGKGGYGDVYKGKLKDGRLVAVKMLNISKSKGEDFINEVASISRTSHVNIVTLLGFCYQGKRRALVYEFVPNGSLEKFIFRKNACDYGQLNWEMLHQISVGIARGLEYLHRGCATPILHFDIKPHNILLDNDFVPKISDFGLAKLCEEKESAISMTGARGTVGYIAPEVFSRNFGRASHKSDVYSYGMMVLEMVGGRKNINIEVDRTSEIYFPDWIYNRIELDEELELQGVTNEDEQERVKKMVIVSLWCIQINPSDRPTMSRVVEMMEGNIDSLKIPPKPVFSSRPTSSPAVSNSST